MDDRARLKRRDVTSGADGRFDLRQARRVVRVLRLVDRDQGVIGAGRAGYVP